MYCAPVIMHVDLLDWKITAEDPGVSNHQYDITDVTYKILHNYNTYALLMLENY